MMMPRARTEDVLTTSVGDELVIYDSRSDRAHRLNGLAAVVWRNADGERDVAGLAEAAGATLAGGVNEDNVRLALQELEQAELLETPAPGKDGTPAMDRRTALKRAAQMGSMALLVPVVSTIAAPTPAMASSSSSGSTSGSTGDSSTDSSCEDSDYSEDSDEWEGGDLKEDSDGYESC